MYGCSATVSHFGFHTSPAVGGSLIDAAGSSAYEMAASTAAGSIVESLIVPMYSSRSKYEMQQGVNDGSCNASAIASS